MVNTTCRRNQADFIKELKPLFDNTTKYGKGIVIIEATLLTFLKDLGLLTKIANTSGTWYEIHIGEISTQFAFMEVASNRYKIVSCDDITELDAFRWKYDKANVYTYIANNFDEEEKEDTTNHIKMYLERAVLSIAKYGKVVLKDNDEAAHHMWYRFCAVESMLRSLNKQTHWAGHKITGNYSRAQCVKIETLDEFFKLMEQLIWAFNILQNREFSIEF